MKNLFLVALLVLACMFIHSSDAVGQTKHHEIGVRFNDFYNFDSFYKTGKTPKKLIRYRFLYSHLGYQNVVNVNDSHPFIVDLGAAIGRETRKNISDKFQFLHGPELDIRNRLLIYKTHANETTIRTSLGYILGFQYNTSSNFSVSVEAVPSLSTEFNFIKGKLKQYELGFSTDSRLVAMNILYRFTTEKKEKKEKELR